MWYRVSILSLLVVAMVSGAFAQVSDCRELLSGCQAVRCDGWWVTPPSMCQNLQAVKRRCTAAEQQADFDGRLVQTGHKPGRTFATELNGCGTQQVLVTDDFVTYTADCECPNYAGIWQNVGDCDRTWNSRVNCP